MTPELSRAKSFCDQLYGMIEKLERERDDAQAKLRELGAKCAEMQEYISTYADLNNSAKARHALSSDYGKGFVRA